MDDRAESCKVLQTRAGSCNVLHCIATPCASKRAIMALSTEQGAARARTRGERRAQGWCLASWGRPHPRGTIVTVGEWHTSGRGAGVMTGKPNPRRAYGHRRDALRARILGRGEPCWICGLPIDPARPNLSPCQGVVDELVPVSKGGSPLDPGNCMPAHRCCNAWRSTKPVAFVRLVQSRVFAMGGASDPLAWCAMARRVCSAIRAGVSATPPPRTSADW